MCYQSGEILIPYQNHMGLRNSGLDFLVVFPTYAPILASFIGSILISSVYFCKTMKIVSWA